MPNSKVIRIILLTAVLLMLATLIYAQPVKETIEDTLYGIEMLDGVLNYNMQWGDFIHDVYSSNLTVGDGHSWFQGGIRIIYSFLSYPLPSVPAGYSLNSATLNIYQHSSEANSELDLYPEFNLENRRVVYPPCLIEHVDYGNYLDTDDFILPALHPADTLSTTADIGWRTEDVTEWVVDDIHDDRSYTQYRLRLALDHDTDSLRDKLGFKSANTTTDFPPFVVYEYLKDTHASEEVIEAENIFVYPQPATRETKLAFTNPNRGHVSVDLYNLKGQKISQVFSGIKDSGKTIISFDVKNISSGIYFLKIKKQGNQALTKKIMVYH